MLFFLSWLLLSPLRRSCFPLFACPRHGAWTCTQPKHVCRESPRGSQKTGVVDRVSIGSAGSIVAIDVESGEILAAKNLEFAGKQVKGGDSTPRWLRDPF